MSQAEAKKTWTVLEMLHWTTQYLGEKGFEQSRFNAEWLLSHVLGCKRLQLYADYDRPLDTREIATYKELLKRRLSGEPLQYVIGETEFFGLRIKVTPDVLIPRPDTEVLVETALGILPPEGDLRILDVGTGSGAIAIALAVQLRKKNRFAAIDAIDISHDAVKIAQQNALYHGVEHEVRFQTVDFLQFALSSQGLYQLVVSNPPYLSEKEFEQAPDEVRRFEPKTALLADEEGLSFYKKLADHGEKLLDKRSRIAVEVGYDQAAAVAEIFREQGFVETKIVNDYSGTPRVVTAGMP